VPSQGVLHIIQFQTQPFGFNNQLLDFALEETGAFQRCRRRQLCDYGTHADMDLE
jgi:hypothetical protein